jgi:hypothetical protein
MKVLSDSKQSIRWKIVDIVQLTILGERDMRNQFDVQYNHQNSTCLYFFSIIQLFCERRLHILFVFVSLVQWVSRVCGAFHTDLLAAHTSGGLTSPFVCTLHGNKTKHISSDWSLGRPHSGWCTWDLTREDLLSPPASQPASLSHSSTCEFTAKRKGEEAAAA